jgi:PilZ domain
MEQQDYSAADVALSDFVSVASTEDALNHGPEHWPLELEAEVVDFLSNYPVRGVLAAFTPGEVTILLNEPVSEQRLVTVSMNSFVFEGHTLYCRPRQNQFETHITIDDVEANGLRRSPRFPVKLPAELLLPSAEPVAITIVDISSEGLGIEVPQSLEPGQPIAVGSESVLVLATIRHCRRLSEGTFRAGAEMHHLFQKNITLPKASPRSNFLQTVLSKRHSKGAGLKFAWR